MVTVPVLQDVMLQVCDTVEQRTSSMLEIEV